MEQDLRIQQADTLVFGHTEIPHSMKALSAIAAQAPGSNLGRQQRLSSKAISFRALLLLMRP